MLVVAYLPLLVAILGLLMYLVSTNAKVQEVGRIMLFTGLLAFLIVVAPTAVVRVGK